MFDKNKHYKVVILDSGVNNNHPVLVKTAPVDACSAIIDCASNTVDFVPEQEDHYGHGTAISVIIRKQFVDEDILMVKIIEDENGCDDEILIASLNYIFENISCDIINMSLGVHLCNRYNDLYQVCKKLDDKGVILVSAFSQSGAVSYPAAFDCVIGIASSFRCSKSYEFELFDDKRINLAGMGKLQRVAWVNPDYLMQSGNSFSCAHATVQIIKFINDGAVGRKNILDEFAKVAMIKHKSTSMNLRKDSLFSISKAAIFPFNKEIHSLVRYSDMLNFEIVSLYDTKYSMRVGTTTKHIMNDETVPDITIENIDNIDWDAFDTLILGHMGDLEQIVRHAGFQKELVDSALEHGKNVYAFDDLNLSLGYKLSEKLYYPIVTIYDSPAIPYEQLFKISKPVLGIFGTSSRQGKFTLQLKLREHFLKDGYKLGQIGTEPSSPLFGMDYVFPMGYKSSVYVKEHDAVKHLNYITNELCIKDCDIIMVGAQGGCIPYDYTMIKMLTIPTLNFLMGTLPDAIILCVNPFDDIDYIKRTINFLESFIQTKVISLVVFPMDLKDNWSGTKEVKEPLSDKKYCEFKKVLTETFNLPVYKLGEEEDMNDLFETATDFFVVDET